MTKDSIDWQVSLMEGRVGSIFITSVSGHISTETDTMGAGGKDLYNTAFQSVQSSERSGSLDESPTCHFQMI